MNNAQVYDYQNEVIGTDELIEEGFQNGMINYDIALKTLLMGIIFYILTNNMVIYYLKQVFGKNLDINIIQTLIFAILFYTLMSSI
jgi:hypothetical protein